MIWHWQFDPIALHVGPLQLHWYGVLFALAFVLGQQLLAWCYRREGYDSQALDSLMPWALIGTVLGARLAHCLIYDPAYYLSQPLAILRVWEGGLASHGGALGLMLALWLYSRRHPQPGFAWLLDRIALPAALGGALVRHSLRPLAALTAAAMAIRPDTLNQRLDASLAPAELLGLVDAFNDALARLDAAFARLSDYAADLAHEMRTPLGILLGQTQVALSRGRSLAEYQQVLADNAEELERLARTVNDLLFLAKTEHSEAALACEWLDVRQEVDEVCEFFALLAEERDIQVQVEGALRLPVARAALRRLLNNLLSNAIRYSPPGSVVRVALDARLPGVAVNNPPAAPLPEPLTMLFERFYSQGDGNGHGLGLPIARAIARQHGGELRASLGDDGRLTLAAQLAAKASLVQARRCS